MISVERIREWAREAKEVWEADGEMSHYHISSIIFSLANVIKWGGPDGLAAFEGVVTDYADNLGNLVYKQRRGNGDGRVQQK